MNADLLERLKQRDPASQQELRLLVFHRVKALCRAILQDEVWAEDMAEDIWMDFLFDHVDRVQHAPAMGAYLRMTTVRRCVRMKSWRKRHDPIDELPDLQHPERELAPDKLARQQDKQRLERCLERLKPQARTVFRLRYEEDLTQDQIASAVGVSKPYIWKVLDKGLKALKACLGE